MKYQTLLLLFSTIITFLLSPFSVQSQSETNDTTTAKISLVQAVMCEDIQELTPQNSTTVFSVERRKAVCYTSFDPVPAETVIYHHWIHRDRSSVRIKLILQPPMWSTYSSIQLRAEDLGPWRVEVTDAQGQIFQVLRFSISE